MHDDEAPRTAWADAVELGAHGRVAAARTALAALVADPQITPALASLAHSTRASLTRQAGGHALARCGDGRACVLAARAVEDPGDAWLSAAWLDGLIGLAADNLGIGEFALSRRLLERARTHLDTAGADPRSGDGGWRTIARSRLRWAWVSAEWGLYAGDLPRAQVAIADARELAAAVPSPRHRLKTALIAAAVDAACGDTGPALAGGEAAFDDAAALDLLPLQWAAASLLAGLSPEAGGWRETVVVLRGRLAERGMAMVPLSSGERLGR